MAYRWMQVLNYRNPIYNENEQGCSFKEEEVMFARLIRFSLCFAIGVFLLLEQPMATDRDALISLYNATGGDSWSDKSGWKDAPTLADGFNNDPCAEPLWFGVTCQEASVTQLSLNSNQLTGEIPS